MKKKSLVCSKDMVSADTRGGSCPPVVEQGPVSADVPLAELRKELMRRISEARTEQSVAIHYEHPRSLDRALAKESALFDLYMWLTERVTAKGTGGNDQDQR